MGKECTSYLTLNSLTCLHCWARSAPRHTGIYVSGPDGIAGSTGAESLALGHCEVAVGGPVSGP